MEIKNSKFCDKCQLRLMHVVTKIMTIFVFKIFIQTCHSRIEKGQQWEHYITTFCNSMLETVLSMACSWSLSGVCRLSDHLSLSLPLSLSLSHPPTHTQPHSHTHTHTKTPHTSFEQFLLFFSWCASRNYEIIMKK